MIGAFLWFFWSDARSAADPSGEHGDQFFGCGLGICAAMLITWVVSSLIKSRSLNKGQDGGGSVEGIDVYKEKTIFQVLRDTTSDSQEDE